MRALLHIPAKPLHLQAKDDPIQRDLRRLFWIGVLQSIACGVIGALAGIIYAVGYLADMAR